MANIQKTLNYRHSSAFLTWFEHAAFRLGGGRSIQLSYRNVSKTGHFCRNWTYVIHLWFSHGLCSSIALGGECSIQLSYADIRFWLTSLTLSDAAVAKILHKCRICGSLLTRKIKVFQPFWSPGSVTDFFYFQPIFFSAKMLFASSAALGFSNQNSQYRIAIDTWVLFNSSQYRSPLRRRSLYPTEL